MTSIAQEAGALSCLPPFLCLRMTRSAHEFVPRLVLWQDQSPGQQPQKCYARAKVAHSLPGDPQVGTSGVPYRRRGPDASTCTDSSVCMSLAHNIAFGLSCLQPVFFLGQLRTKPALRQKDRIVPCEGSQRTGIGIMG